MIQWMPRQERKQQKFSLMVLYTGILRQTDFIRKREQRMEEEGYMQETGIQELSMALLKSLQMVILFLSVLSESVLDMRE